MRTLKNYAIIVYESKWAISYKYRCKVLNKDYKIQLVKYRTFDKETDVLDTFDYTICQFLYNGKELITNEIALEDLNTKSLHFNNIVSPIRAIKRARKYSDLGFKMDFKTVFELGVYIATHPKIWFEVSKY